MIKPLKRLCVAMVALAAAGLAIAQGYPGKPVKDPAMSAKLADQAVELVGGTPEEFGRFIRSEHDKWGKLIRDARLSIEQ